MRAIGSNIFDRVGGGSLDSMKQMMVGGIMPMWAFARFQTHEGKVRTGYVVAYAGGVAWITAKSLAMNPKRWGPDDFLIQANTLEAGVVTPSPEDVRMMGNRNFSHLQVTPVGSPVLQVRSSGAWYAFTHLDQGWSVADNVDRLIGDKH